MNQEWAPTRAHLSRLMKLWRSAGWPSRDSIDLDLLAAGWVALVGDHPAHECLKLTPAGIEALTQSRQKLRCSESEHDHLALKMADHLMESGRLVWRELSLRAKIETDVAGVAKAGLGDGSARGAKGEWHRELPAGRNAAQSTALFSDTPDMDVATLAGMAQVHYTWRVARPDLFSVRRTSQPEYLHPMVHEIKVSRADLLSDLRNEAKRASHKWLCSECHYVFPHGVAEPQELPEELGVWVLHGDIEGGRLEMLRPARHKPCTLPFEAESRQN